MSEKIRMTSVSQSVSRYSLLVVVNSFLLRSTCISRKLLLLSAAALIWLTAGVAQANIFDTASTLKSDLSNFNFIDVVVDGSNTYALATQKTGGVSYTDPDGTVSYERNIYILKVDSAGNLTQSKFATLNSQQGTLSLQGNSAKVFLNYKTQNGTYGMAGKFFSLDKSSLTVASSVALFSNANWGWFPKITADDVEHFSFAGYYRYKNTTNLGSVLPSVMQSEFNSYQASHSQNIMPNSDVDVVNAIVARVVTTPTPSTACTGTSASIDLTTMRVCLPTVSVPTVFGGGSIYNVVLSLISGSNPLKFTIQTAAQITSLATPSASYVPTANALLIPALQVPDLFGGVQTYRVDLSAIQSGGSLEFVLNSATPTGSTPAPVTPPTTTQPVTTPITTTACNPAVSKC